MKKTLIILFAVAGICCADVKQNIIEFPEDAGIVDVTKAPYSATPDDDKDDTSAIQQALNDHASKNKIIYLPEGTYLVSDTLEWPKGPKEGARHKRTILQGAGKNHTIIKLADNCEKFQNITKDKRNRPVGKAVIMTGYAPAQRFRNAVRDLTIDVGMGNPGAIGMQFIANNQGCVRNVRIRTEDVGLIGLDLGYTDEQGPCLIKSLTVEGFQYGIYTWGHVDSITFADIKLQKQKDAGIYNDNQVSSIENLFSEQTGNVPSVLNKHEAGVVTIIGGNFVNNSKDAKHIINNGTLYGQNLEFSNGFKNAIVNKEGKEVFRAESEKKLKEYISSPPETLNDNKNVTGLFLPIKPTPEAPHDPLSEWISPIQFGGKPNDNIDDTEAIQKAIDSGKTTVYLPNGKWTIKGNLYLRGNVRRFVGCETTLEGKGTIHFDDGSQPFVVFERIETMYSNININQKSKRTFVISSCRLQRGADYIFENGELFLEDVAGDRFFFKNQKVWARQLNPERDSTKITAENSRIWILGLKTEGDGTTIEQSGGETEICGAFIYANTRRPKQPMVVLDKKSRFSMTMGESSFRGFQHETLIIQKTEHKEKVFKKEDAQRRGEGSKFALFSTH